jgi:hypothetical protein
MDRVGARVLGIVTGDTSPVRLKTVLPAIVFIEWGFIRIKNLYGRAGGFF